MRTRLGATTLAVSTFFVLSACSSTTGGPEPSSLSSSEMSSEQLDAMGDGEITADEYQSSFQRFRDCLSDAGYELTTQGEENKAIQYSIPVAAVNDGTEDACYTSEFQQVDMNWQLAHQDTSESTQILRECLIEAGIAPENSTEAIVEQIREAGIDMVSCGE